MRVKTIIVVFILFGCSVVCGHEIDGKLHEYLKPDKDGSPHNHYVDPIYKINNKLGILEKDLEDLGMQMASTFAVVTFEFEYQVEQLKERVEELENILLEPTK